MKKTIKQFKLKKEYFTSVMYNKYIKLYDLDGEIIAEGDTLGTKDHPEFTKLRIKLGKLGYISIELLFWNGDRVLKPFKLNQLSFEKGDQFSCATVLGIKLDLLKPKKIV
jgi:hypothetical protein